MTVKELIEKLEQCQPDAEVYFRYFDELNLSYKRENVDDVDIEDGEVFLE